jgi:hypothetical protein
MIICAATNKVKYKSVVTTYKLSTNPHNGITLPCHKPEKTKIMPNFFFDFKGIVHRCSLHTD